jgi:hypothetical protein
MSLQDYQLTTAGDLHVVHSGVVARAGRKIQLDSASPATAKLLAMGWITTTITGGAKYHDDAAGNAQVFHVTAAGAGHLLHSTGNPPSSTPLTFNAVVSLDPQDAGTVALLARGLIS